MLTREEFCGALARNNPAFRLLYAYWLDDAELAPLRDAAERLFRRDARRRCKAKLASVRDGLWFVHGIIEAKRIMAARPRVAAQQRRARILNATPDWDADLTQFVTQEAADLARRREAATGFAWHIDHMIPLQACTVSGLHTWANLQVIPAAMNLAKGNRMRLLVPGEWLRHM